MLHAFSLPQYRREKNLETEVEARITLGQVIIVLLHLDEKYDNY